MGQPPAITKEQFEAHAQRMNGELANRQVLVRGVGAPSFDAPEGAEYEDASTTPASRYRKTSPGPSGWTNISLSLILGGAPAPGLQQVQAVPTTGTGFTISVPPGMAGGTLPLLIKGHDDGDVLEDITGGDAGQVVTLQRGEPNVIRAETNETLKLSGAIQLDDAGLLDNITLQRLNADCWVELARAEF